MSRIKHSELTPEHIYLSRREFMQGIGAIVTSAVALSACAPLSPSNAGVDPTASAAPTAIATMDELGAAATPFATVTGLNNFYEFTTDKEGVAKLAEGFVTEPWTLTVGGLVEHPGTYSVDDLGRRFPPQERVYRMRCVEGWSMVIPWLGFPLAGLLREVAPLTAAKYVRFEALYDPEALPGQRRQTFSWPYVEGLRLDEAMNDLTLIATGLYGKSLLPQSGAPLRLVVPWKYGFKSIKSIVKIDLVEEMPVSLWMAAAPGEYGFYANVNPDVPHPRWSQASERRIGESASRPTLPFNGYGEQVAGLYEGMDLVTNF